MDSTFVRYRGWAALVLVCGVLSTGLTGCGDWKKRKEDQAAKETKPEDELVPVEVVALQKGPMEAVLRFSTNLEAESSVQVFSQAQRLVTQLLVEEGQAVAKGQVLVRLQDDEQRSAIARIQSQLTKAEREYQRQQNLFDKQLISEQAFNDAKYQVEQLQIALADAQRELTYTEVKAPIQGVITARKVNLGDNVKVGQNLFDMVDFNTIVARVFVPERQIARLRLGQVARIIAPSLGGSVTEGTVLRIAPTVDPKSGTIKTTIKVPTGNRSLVPGLYVETELVVDKKADALLLPKRAVVYDDTEAYVYRVKPDDTVERLRINPVLEDRDYLETAATDGLAAGDKIVVAGQAGLKSGTKVRLAGAGKVTTPGSSL